MAQVLIKTVQIQAAGDVGVFKFEPLVPQTPPFFVIYVPDFAPVPTNTLAGWVRPWTNASGSTVYMGDEQAVPYNGRVLVQPRWRIESPMGTEKPWGMAFRTQKYVVPGKFQVYYEDADTVVPEY